MSTTPHDSLFKAVFSHVEHAAPALRVALPPAIAARLDFDTLTLCPGSFIDEHLAASHSDLLFSAAIGGRRALVYILYEHQSTADPLMPFRLLRYMLRIWDAHLAEQPAARILPAILPVVLHHSERGWQGAVAFEALLDLDPETLTALADHVPRFRFVLDDVSGESDESLRARAMTALGLLALWCFRHARQPVELVMRFWAWQDLVEQVLEAPNGMSAWRRVMRYLVTRFNADEQHAVLKKLREGTRPKVKEKIVEFELYWEKQGYLKGLVEGHRKGLDEGRLDAQRTLLLKQLTRRFGELPEAAAARVQAASSADLELWAERVLTAGSLTEVLGEG